MKKISVFAATLAAAGLVASASASTVTNGGTTATNSNFGTITIDASGNITVVAPTGTYDGVEDVVYNVYNNSAISYTGFAVTGTGIAGFDGDGIDNYAHADGTVYHNYGDGGTGSGLFPSDQGYAGYANGLAADANIYSGYVLGGNTVNVTFGGGGILAGGTAFISFEAPGGANGNPIGVGPMVPLPPAVWSGMVLVLGLGAYSKFYKAKVA